MSTIKFRIAAKTDVGVVRTNNEDNFQASDDLSDSKMRWVNNEICSLGDKGALLVVADGMGGMNAGEVASNLAIATVREYFSPDKLTSDILKTRFSVEKYMSDVIIAADSRIKAEARIRPETKGMGTTIVIGWILDGKLYVSWCGDSRTYIYNPSAGLHQITKDHSYVQGLIDKGSITREEAFDFPDSNIITRCLSDATAKAKPESLLKPYELCDNDIIMLCTDGLSGMLHDVEMESIINANEHNMDILADELIKAACDAEGSDNITICLCQILQCGKQCNPAIFVEYDKRLNGNKDPFIRTLIQSDKSTSQRYRYWWYIGLVFLLILIGSAFWWFGFREKSEAGIVKEQSTSVKEIVPNADSSIMGERNKTEADNNPSIIPESKVRTKKNDNTSSGSIFPKIQKGGNAEATEGADSKATEGESELTIIVDETENTNVGHQNESEVPNIATKKYTVLEGDTYFSLSKRFKTKVAVLQRINNNVELKAGTIINIPQ